MSKLDEADREVLRMARAARFAPGAALTLPSGRVVYPGRRRRAHTRVEMLAAKLRYASMYATSSTIGYFLLAVIRFSGDGVRDARAVIRGTAREHARDALVKRGPYLAPYGVIVVTAVMCALLIVAWIVSEGR